MTDHIDVRFAPKWWGWPVIRAAMFIGILTRIDTKPWFGVFMGWLVSKGFRYEVATNDKA